MTYATVISDRQNTATPVTSRAELASLLRRICADVGAERYMLVEPSVERGSKSVQIITSNWVFDALEELGSAGIASIVESGLATGAGAAPRMLGVANSTFLSATEKRALHDHGTAEICCQKISLNGATVFALFSASAPRLMDILALARAHMKCTYALNQYFAKSRGQAASGPLSERERECLAWVSEGKTTDEVALILGVSSNTVNSYVAHAIQKFGASNRAMAIATAIRSGII
ncbi:LuxR C-terminal-related transcriptional regulator [Mesorhizobium sp. CAU 1732]|uniref:helix-turn-helix transcriptional regulator n=1 Tax=Mesorhizobium sp. CAU 1732 TaxID=3140358 RepID=UPI003260516B